MAQGLLVVGLVTLSMVAVVGGLLHAHEIAVLTRRLARRLSPAPDPQVAGPPIERIANDARRLRSELLALTPGTPMAKRRGVWQAYDDLLADACRALGVPDALSDLPPGPERDLTRLRVEHQLEGAGLRLQP